MIPFTKAHACGNDFLIVLEDLARGMDPAALARQLCARTTGVGADGVEFFAWTGQGSARIRLYNADGSTAEISGNGTRCVAAFMAQFLRSQPGDTLVIVTDAGPRLCRIDAVHGKPGFSVDVMSGMGEPQFASRNVTLADGSVIAGTDVSMGNPHFVVEVDNAEFQVAGKTWKALGAEICFHADFAQQTNVEFVRVLSPEAIEIRIFERGVGPTSSSGTGTAASATAARVSMLCGSPLTVRAPGGAQTVVWHGPGTELLLTGPAALIARGEAFLP